MQKDIAAACACVEVAGISFVIPSHGAILVTVNGDFGDEVIRLTIVLGIIEVNPGAVCLAVQVATTRDKSAVAISACPVIGAAVVDETGGRIVGRANPEV